MGNSELQSLSATEVEVRFSDGVKVASLRMNREAMLGIEIQEAATPRGVGLNSQRFTAHRIGEGNEAIGNHNIVFIADDNRQRSPTMPRRCYRNRCATRRLLREQDARPRNQRWTYRNSLKNPHPKIGVGACELHL